MSKYQATRRSRSPTPDYGDSDADYKLALKMSAEWNYEEHALQDAVTHYNEDADLALAMQLEYELETAAAATETAEAAIRSSTPLREPDRTWSDASSSKESIRRLVHENPIISEYRPESSKSKAKMGSFVDFATYMRTYNCPLCHTPFFQSGLDVVRILDQWNNSNNPLSSWIKCTICPFSGCVACSPEPFAQVSRLKVQEKQITWCCAGGRLYLIWTLLCDFDRKYCALRSKPVITRRSIRKLPSGGSSKGKSRKHTRGGGVGFGGGRNTSATGMPNGMGYGSDYDDYEEMKSEALWSNGYPLGPLRAPSATRKPPSRAVSAQTSQQTEDASNTLILWFLIGLLPSLERDTGFDLAPPGAVSEMLMGSKVLNYCAELLRNDSLEDVTGRRDIYSAVLGFLRTIGYHFSTSCALFGGRPVSPDAINIFTVSFSVVANPTDITYPLAESLRNLNTQSIIILRNARRNENDFRTEEGQTMLWICRHISELSQFIVANSHGEISSNGESAKQDLAIGEVSEDQILPTYVYGSIAKALQQSKPGRFKRLITEITNLKTGLPLGIFVRYCEDRPDILKCVIIGPAGTPYENGLFEFDFFCGAEFPNAPPMINFKGTGGGQVSINPNLYRDGKVCLSLLGTWEGEPWKPGESTLLQVLITLQAMILCEEPWYNEPGREALYHHETKNGQAAVYNQNIHEMTVQHAMLTWLDDTPALWADIVRRHFQQHANAILKTTSDWAKQTIALTPHSRFHGLNDLDFQNYYQGLTSTPEAATNKIPSMLAPLQTALRIYGATFEVPNIPQKLEPPKRPTLAPRLGSSLLPPPMPPSLPLPPLKQSIRLGNTIPTPGKATYGPVYQQFPKFNPFAGTFSKGQGSHTSEQTASNPLPSRNCWALQKPMPGGRGSGTGNENRGGRGGNGGRGHSTKGTFWDGV